MRFKIGDRVEVKETSSIKTLPMYVDNLSLYSNKQYEIHDTIPGSLCGNGYYRLTAIDNDRDLGWNFHEDMLTLVSTTVSKYDLNKVGVVTVAPFKVRVRDTENREWYKAYFMGNSGGCTDYPYMAVLVDSHINNETKFEQSIFKYCEHIPEVDNVPFTIEDYAKLPFGTRYIFNTGTVTINPQIYSKKDELHIGSHKPEQFKGYILPNETEVRPFTKEV